MSPVAEPTPPTPAVVEFGRRLRARREELGLSQEAAAAKAGVHWSYYARAERGQRSSRIDSILKLAHGLDTTPGALMDGLPLAPDAN
ncbi:helix-turn-helix domain-containing protein [Tsukamurella sp. PLM1]|uniref:helix-turn-helix domain-containing protein n=1 Tax=Tsukamurella sp. PLM1 TaxID=2929795 RepID=UPI0020619AF0|nr:helix-turn-helix transcriptional regulator [Tsukamurella sp. PLM1]BDH56588.1 hypothetical protein MTP03_15270 [Tsukamurella sp. PLM1]